MSLSIQLPTDNGALEQYTLRGPGNFVPATAHTKLKRIAYSAAHVVADPLAAIDPWLQSRVDWDATIAYRQRLWSMGFGVAEAMDTAQRGMGLDCPTSLELIRRSLDAAKDVPGATVASLIEGDGVGGAPTHRHSDALLGIFDAIAPAASAALAALAQGDNARFHEILAPTVPLSRHIFQTPTRFYKTGVVFMAWLNGHQGHFVMVGGQQSTRSLPRFAELFRLADAAGLLEKPELAVRRMKSLLALVE